MKGRKPAPVRDAFVNIRTTTRILDQLRKLAENEQRSISSMCSILLEEAIEERQSQ